MPDNPTALRKKLLENRMEQMRRQWARPKGLEATLSIVIALATAIAAIAAVAFLCWVMPPLVAQISDWAAQTHDCKGYLAHTAVLLATVRISASPPMAICPDTVVNCINPPPEWWSG